MSAERALEIHLDGETLNRLGVPAQAMTACVAIQENVPGNFGDILQGVGLLIAAHTAQQGQADGIQESIAVILQAALATNAAITAAVRA